MILSGYSVLTYITNVGDLDAWFEYIRRCWSPIHLYAQLFIWGPCPLVCFCMQLKQSAHSVTWEAQVPLCLFPVTRMCYLSTIASVSLPLSALPNATPKCSDDSVTHHSYDKLKGTKPKRIIVLVEQIIRADHCFGSCSIILVVATL